MGGERQPAPEARDMADANFEIVAVLVEQMPHYHIVEATKAVKPVLGEYFKEPEKSGPIPFHLLKQFFKGAEVSIKGCCRHPMLSPFS